MKAKFISLEGGEGTGKTTQINRLKAHLEAKGLDVVVTREPGGTHIGEAIREIILKGDTSSMDGQTEAMLLFAARRNHVEKLIKPALAKGTWVISDRFFDSTMAYQGYAGGVGAETIKTLQHWALGDFTPDLTLIFDIPVKIGLDRAGIRMAGDNDAEDRFERMGIDFHQTMREAFLEIADGDQKRCEVIDANSTIDDVDARIWAVVKSRFDLGA
jgi:dTMP kinase